MPYESWKFAVLVAVVFLLICYVLTSDTFGIRSTLSQHLPVMDPSHEYNYLYKGSLVALSTLVALGFANGRVVFNEKVNLTAF